jgi:hypothetical protein
VAVTLYDFTSGKLLEIERKWLEENPFPENVVPYKSLKFFEGKSGQLNTGPGVKPKPENYLFEMKHLDIQFILADIDYSDPSIRPTKVISYYVLWDEELFNSLGFTDKVFEENRSMGVNKDNKYAKLGIMSWAWLNPDGSTVICHTLVGLNTNYVLEESFKYKNIIMPLVDVTNYKEYRPDLMIAEDRVLMQIYSLYLELKPLELAKKWVSTKIMPREMENKLFGIGSGIWLGE